MREIKFRAWDKINKSYVNPFNLPNGEMMVLTLNGELQFSDDGTYKQSDFELMQYTGLKDKNGKDIYEGDIVHCISQMDAGNLVVIFQEGEFIMKQHPSNHGYYALRCFTKEVVGNIYEPITV